MARPPLMPAISAAAMAIFSALRLIRATLAPSAANLRAMPRLMPLDPPATNSVLPA